MSAPVRRAAAASLVLLAGACAACARQHDACSELGDALRRCDLATGDFSCDGVGTSTAEELLARLETDGCSALGQATQPGDAAAVDPRVCALGGFSCPPPPTPHVDSAATQFPLVFVSGIDDHPVFDWSPRIVASIGVGSDARAEHVTVLPWATVPERTADLWASLEQVLARTGASKVNLVCWAVGGLDCRYLVSPGGLFRDDRAGRARAVSAIASITTIATPHRGTRVAEAAISALRTGVASDLIAALLGTATSAPIPDDAAMLRALEGLTLEAAIAFDRDVIDEPAVFYQSFAGVSAPLGRASSTFTRDVLAHCVDADGAPADLGHPGTVDALSEALWITAPFSTVSYGPDRELVTGPSDGMIAVESAKWGLFRGCLPADHYDLVGQLAHTTRDARTGFDPQRFYRWLAADLASRGF
ncbi:MAG: hypothetical protein NVSMB47_10020 [Polyangiales bacterium]